MPNLDALTRRHTAFRTFAELTSTSLDSGYVPTLSRPATWLLADEFDAAMTAAGSSIRAWRGLK